MDVGRRGGKRRKKGEGEGESGTWEGDSGVWEMKRQGGGGGTGPMGLMRRPSPNCCVYRGRILPGLLLEDGCGSCAPI